MWICVPCDKFFNGIQPYKDHLNSERHKTKIKQNQNFMVEPMQDALSNASSKDLEKCIIPFNFGFKCIPCDTFLNSSQQAEQHKNGEKHKKKAANYTDKYSVKSYNPIIDSPCHKSSNAVPQYESDFNLEKSINEGKQNQNSQDELMQVILPNTSLGDLDECLTSFNSGFKCDACEKYLNSHQQAKQHVSSEKHKKMKNKTSYSIKISSEICDSSSFSDNHPNFDEKNYLMNKLSVHDIEIENLLNNIKVFQVNEPISFD